MFKGSFEEKKLILAQNVNFSEKNRKFSVFRPKLFQWPPSTFLQSLSPVCFTNNQFGKKCQFFRKKLKIIGNILKSVQIKENHESLRD